jgi:hypothetical protein
MIPAKGRYGGLLNLILFDQRAPQIRLESSNPTEWEWNEDGTTLTLLAPGHKMARRPAVHCRGRTVHH